MHSPVCRLLLIEITFLLLHRYLGRRHTFQLYLNAFIALSKVFGVVWHHSNYASGTAEKQRQLINALSVEGSSDKSQFLLF